MGRERNVTGDGEGPNKAVVIRVILGVKTDLCGTPFFKDRLIGEFPEKAHQISTMR